MPEIPDFYSFRAHSYASNVDGSYSITVEDETVIVPITASQDELQEAADLAFGPGNVVVIKKYGATNHYFAGKFLGMFAQVNLDQSGIIHLEGSSFVLENLPYEPPPAFEPLPVPIPYAQKVDVMFGGVSGSFDLHVSNDQYGYIILAVGVDATARQVQEIADSQAGVGDIVAHLSQMLDFDGNVMSTTFSFYLAGPFLQGTNAITVQSDNVSLDAPGAFFDSVVSNMPDPDPEPDPEPEPEPVPTRVYIRHRDRMVQKSVQEDLVNTLIAFRWIPGITTRPVFDPYNAGAPAAIVTTLEHQVMAIVGQDPIQLIDYFPEATSDDAGLAGEPQSGQTPPNTIAMDEGQPGEPVPIELGSTLSEIPYRFTFAFWAATNAIAQALLNDLRDRYRGLVIANDTIALYDYITDPTTPAGRLGCEGFSYMRDAEDTAAPHEATMYYALLEVSDEVD